MIAEKAIQESAVTGKAVYLSFNVEAHSHLMVRAAVFTDYLRLNQIEFSGNELGRPWTVKMESI